MAGLQLSASTLGLTSGDFGLRTWRAVAAELVATALFVFVGAGAVVTVTGVLGKSPSDDAAALVVIALAHGFAIAVLVAALATISGGHINPAVTFAATITGRIKLTTGVLYVTAQLAGAVLGASLLKAVFANDVEGNLGAHSLNLDALASTEMGCLLEIILTFVLVFVVFATAIDARGYGGIAPLAIGLTVMIDHFIGVPLTGASMNPARSFGPAAIANVWDDHWVYWAGPLVGGGLAGLVYYFFYIYRRGEERGVPPAVAEE
ncbi:MAG: MIP family channel protein [Chloroflexi bacterium]|nr:MIP family channel protein [Chloroflexota bacterium]